MTFNVNIFNFVNVLLTFIRKTKELKSCSSLWFEDSQTADFSSLAKFLQKTFSKNDIPMDITFDLHLNRIADILSPLLNDYSIFFQDHKNKILGSCKGTGNYYILIRVLNDIIDIELTRANPTTFKRALSDEAKANPKPEPEPTPSTSAKNEPPATTIEDLGMQLTDDTTDMDSNPLSSDVDSNTASPAKKPKN